MSRKKLILKIFIALCMVILIMFTSSYLFVNSIVGPTNHKDVYALEKNSIDVLFVGSSHCYCGFSPEVFYEQTGVKSYTLGGSSQSMLSCYLWTKEFYERQKYSTLVVEAFSIPMSHGDVGNDIHTLASMYPSKNYMEMALTYKRNCDKVIFPILCVHSEWDRIDLREIVNAYHKENLGYVDIHSRAGEEYTESVLKGDKDADDYLGFTYLDKIVDFCNQNNIRLILVKTLIASNESDRWDDAYHNKVSKYAKEKGIEFIDFNDPVYMEDAGLVIAEDVAADLRHLNADGAYKTTTYIGKHLYGE
ncbi:MAG: SGNH/GDSL hydrolase family protein [Lachnospiraceae bacterium]|nr:SGNH/GDSL hydrolase family protein [Lachnospiraceae bacterium]